MNHLLAPLGAALLALLPLADCIPPVVELASETAPPASQNDDDPDLSPVSTTQTGTPKKTAPPASLPQKVRLAWVTPGVAFNGWMSLQEWAPEFRATKDPLEPGPGKLGEVPAFRWYGWKAGLAAKLPEPTQPFGLDLGGAAIDDAGLKELATFKNLRMLSLTESKVTDAGVPELAAHKQLTLLNLGSLPVTDAGLKDVARNPELRWLFLYQTKITDAGLKDVAKLKQLQLLDLSADKVTDAGVKELAALKQLDTLVLYKTDVTDAGLKELAGLQQLQLLHLEGTRITDAGLRELAGLRRLRVLVLRECKVTDAGVGQLEKALPNLKISR